MAPHASFHSSSRLPSLGTAKVPRELKLRRLKNRSRSIDPVRRESWVRTGKGEETRPGSGSEVMAGHGTTMGIGSVVLMR